MMNTTAFWCGMGTGIVAGAAVAMMAGSRQQSMKTPVGKAMQKAGAAMDHAMDSFITAMEK
ncbi:hypothetical protein H8790_00345 [Oscillibacter hominis]|uniref:Uncharacterized protein n=1 Tax=Oscillibacter hominis TaxID=2763056 RepID=A0A7G9B4R4_9FIRM|nr:hypothetical protein [Oscillibacter hominis]QNL44545.1 hypothetical protein H8790_00345 [Oscillibacter hominis]